MNQARKESGLLLSIIFAALFLIIAQMLSPHFDGAHWYLVSSIQRILFFGGELLIFVRLFNKEKLSNVLHLHNFKSGIIAGLAMLIYIVFYLITYCMIGAKEWIDTTIPIVISCLFLQQLSTGLWEELTFRAFVCEGYYQSEKQTVKKRFLYAAVSFLIFGIGHAIECDTLETAVYRFITTGVWGFAFASIYLYTHNILAAAFMHFFTDIFLNLTTFIDKWNDSTALTVLDNYVNFVFLGIILLAAIYFLRKEPKNEIQIL